jgi:hypothetical protein
MSLARQSHSEMERHGKHMNYHPHPHQSSKKKKKKIVRVGQPQNKSDLYLRGGVCVFIRLSERGVEYDIRRKHQLE